MRRKHTGYWLLALIIYIVVRNGSAVDLTCDDTTTYALVQEDACLFYECREADGLQGKRACPSGYAVPATYTRGGTTHPCTEVNDRCGLCHFPPSVLHSRRWMYGYIYDAIRAYFTQTFTETATEVTSFSTVDYLCVDSGMVGDERYGVRLQLMTNPSGFLKEELFYQCVQHRFVDNEVILQKQNELVNIKPTLKSCMDSKLPNIPWYRVLLEFPDGATTFQPPAVTCPFPEGVYYVAANLHDNRTGVCGGSNTSTAEVYGSTIEIDLCEQAAMLPVSFTCHHLLAAADVDGGESTNGDVLLVSRAHEVYSEHRVFYCVRYHNTWNQIFLGFTQSTPNSLDCAEGATYTSHGPFVENLETSMALTLTDWDLTSPEFTTQQPTTTGQVPTTVVSTTQREATTQPSTTVVGPTPATNSADLDRITVIIIALATTVAVLLLLIGIIVVVCRRRSEQDRKPIWLQGASEENSVGIPERYETIPGHGGVNGVSFVEPMARINTGIHNNNLDRYHSVGNMPPTSS